MLLRSPSSLPISANVVALKPLRAKHFAAASRIAATRGLFQSTLRGVAPLSLVCSVMGGWNCWAEGSTVVINFTGLSRPVGRGHHLEVVEANRTVVRNITPGDDVVNCRWVRSFSVATVTLAPYNLSPGMRTRTVGRAARCGILSVNTSAWRQKKV